MQVLSLDLMKAGLELPRVGTPVTLPAPLLSLTWGSFGIANRVSKVRRSDRPAAGCCMPQPALHQ